MYSTEWAYDFTNSNINPSISPSRGEWTNSRLSDRPVTPTKPRFSSVALLNLDSLTVLLVLLQGSLFAVSRMGLKFAPNISLMFKELANLPDRYLEAAKRGFTAVECQFPYEVPIDEMIRAKYDAGVSHVLINSYPGMSLIPSRLFSSRNRLRSEPTTETWSDTHHYAIEYAAIETIAMDYKNERTEKYCRVLLKRMME